MPSDKVSNDHTVLMFLILFQHWPLEDWVATLQEGRDNMDDLRRLQEAPPPTAVRRDLTPVGTVDFTLQAILFKALYRFQKQTKGIIMLYNFQCAAFHLSFMLKGYTTNDKLVCLLLCRSVFQN
jgi:hypothetical protein